ncbi:MAG: LysR substrate-binding domain-containing protein [Rhodospirillaceae bacterium]
MRNAAPGIRVAVLAETGKSLAERLAQGSADLALVTDEPWAVGLPSRRLFREDYVCVARRDHPFRGRRLFLAAYCGQEHAVVSPVGGEFATPVDDTLAGLGVSRRVAVSLPGFHLMLGIVWASDILALVPKRIADCVGATLRRFDSLFDLPRVEVSAC